MSEVKFYHLTTSNLKTALPKLIDNIYKLGKKAVIYFKDESTMKEIDNLIWTFSRSFIPHGTCFDEFKEKQPIYLTTGQENPTDADIFIFTENTYVPKENFDKILVLFDGNNKEELDNTRKLWQSLKSENISVTYYKQNENGSWVTT